jgi:hypothetical protein
MRSPEFSIPQQESELKQEKVLHFDNVKITPEKPFEFDVHVKKEPITIKDGDRVTGNGIGMSPKSRTPCPSGIMAKRNIHICPEEYPQPAQRLNLKY